MPPSNSTMLSEIRATIEAFGDAFLADYLSVNEMNMLRNCVSPVPQPRFILLQAITASKKAVESIRQQHTAIDAGLRAMDALYAENKGWDDRVSAFIANMNHTHDPEEVLALFNHDEDFASGFTDESGLTPFMWACHYGHFHLVEKMLPSARLSDTLFEDGQTALLMAIENGHTDIAFELIMNGADISQGRKDGYTPLMAAAEFGNTKLVKTIMACSQLNMDNDGVTEYVNRSGGGGGKKHWSHTALIWAISAHQIETAQVIAESAFSDARTVAKSGYNALIMAASCYNNEEDINLFILLLNETANLNEQTTMPTTTDIFDRGYSMLGYTALLYACETGSSKKVYELLNAGANPNLGVAQLTSTLYTYTPLMAAHGDYDITRLLLKAGASVDCEFKLSDGEMKRALDFAAFAGGDGYDLIELAESLNSRRAAPPLPRSRCSSIGDVTDDDMPALIPVC